MHKYLSKSIANSLLPSRSRFCSVFCLVSLLFDTFAISSGWSEHTKQQQQHKKNAVEQVFTLSLLWARSRGGGGQDEVCGLCLAWEWNGNCLQNHSGDHVRRHLISVFTPGCCNKQPATETATETESESESERDAEAVLDPERVAKRELKFEKFCYESLALSRSLSVCGKLLY